MNQIQEGIICQMWHPGIPEPSKDVRCKDRDVQSELSTLRGWELTFGLIPGLLTAIPYGIIADRYGRKVVLSLSLFGITLVQAVDIIICWFPDTFPLRLVWLGAMFTSVGGGPFVLSAMIFAIANDVSNEAQRSFIFFYLAAATIGGELIAGPVAYLAMTRGAWFSVFMGAGCLSAAILVALAFPETRNKAARDESTRDDGDGDQPENSPSLRLFRCAGLRACSKLALKQATTSVRSYFWDDKRLGLLLFSLVFTSLGKFISVILMQYTTKRFHWSWSEAALLSCFY
ncbi:hypothetical protein G6O67_008435 [Ophiocordyceps sinensis]|uniref:Major facilitator superfamily (MFS) profile domain-containing protein n=1 Tax=Ophiocordyceps sinensis TaxID=72228 RepID=A0A8H4PFY8_9HYPO|nr:hypothetical protein G6O67_008435 [Ophiocordyceps sinensis]